MSGIAEDALCGIVTEVLKTCFVYGYKKIEIMRHMNKYKNDELVRMEKTVGRLLSIQELYSGIWTHVPHNERNRLGKCLGYMHNLLCENPQGHDILKVVYRGQVYEATAPEVVYSHLGQFRFEIEENLIASDETWGFIDKMWESTKEKMARLHTRFQYAVKTMEKNKKLILVLNDWIDYVDDLLGHRYKLLMLKKTISIEEAVRQTRGSNLPNTYNQVGMVLSHLAPSHIMASDSNLNPSFRIFDLENVRMIDDPRHLSRGATFQDFADSSLGQGNTRHFAMVSSRDSEPFSEQKVIIEYKPFADNVTAVYSEEEREDVRRNVRNLIRALRIGSRNDGKFHVLDCLGYCEFSSAIGLVFKLPFEQPDRYECRTLTSLLSQNSPLSNSLNARFSLAAALAWTLSEFHLVHWVHKNFTSDNILLFRKLDVPDDHAYSWDSPFLVGFELARANIGASRPSFPIEAIPWRSRAYLHPKRVRTQANDPFRRFSKRHDIYSFGVILLELSGSHSVTSPDQTVTNLNDTTEGRRAKQLQDLTKTELYDEYLRRARCLGGTMGTTYMDVTRRCLLGDFEIAAAEEYDEGTKLTELFISYVCEPLQSIQV